MTCASPGLRLALQVHGDVEADVATADHEDAGGLASRFAHEIPLPQRVAGHRSTARSESRGTSDHCIEHVSGELAGEGVLLARVVAPEHRQRPRGCFGTVAEDRSRRRHRIARRLQRRPEGRPGEAPSTRIVVRVGSSSCRSRTNHPRQVSRSASVGLLSGGAQCTAASTRVLISRWSSSAEIDVGIAASPARCNAAKSQSPLRSPVKIRPVRLPPWAAGASPTTASEASAGPQEGTGRPQYVSLAYEARLVSATSSRQATNRGQARQPITASSSWSVEPQRLAASHAPARSGAGSSVKGGHS